MKKMIVLLVLSVGFLWAPKAWAGSKDAAVPSWVRTNHWENKNSFTPRQRIRENEKKADENPSLRGRWNHKSQEPASEGSLMSDNLAQKILLKFREDESLSKLAVKLKVSSSKGAVTLDGFVNNNEERNLFEKKAGQIEGVKKVINQLKVKSSDKDLLG